MSKIAKKMFKDFALLILGAVMAIAILIWYLNHSQCEGLTWSGDVGGPAFMPIDAGNCMRTNRAQEYDGVWESGHELGYFYPIDSKSGEIISQVDPLPLRVDHVTQYMIREKLNLNDDIVSPQKYRIRFLGNLMTNYYKEHSGYSDHLDIVEIKSISVFEGEVPRVR